MGRRSGLPIIYDYLKSISIADLKKWDLLRSSYPKQGNITWSQNGVINLSVGYNIVFSRNKEFVLNYHFEGRDYNYGVRISLFPSNLGKGTVNYFVCPVTGIPCRKLHLYNGIFQHRTNIKGFYQWQLYSHKDRLLCRTYDDIKISGEAEYSLNRKHFRKFYLNVPTKRYRKIIYQISKGVGYDDFAIEKLMAGIPV